MEQAIKKRDNILFAISFAVEWFLRHQKESNKAKNNHPGTFESGIVDVLEHIGLAVDANIVAIFRMNLEKEGVDTTKIQYVWTAPGTPQFLSQPGKIPSGPAFTPSIWKTHLAQGNSISGDIAQFPEVERQYFEKNGISSMAMLPLFKDDALWGFIAITTDQVREWTDAEMEALRMAGNMVGALLG
jgi:GAF domain-containing protein